MIRSQQLKMDYSIFYRKKANCTIIHIHDAGNEIQKNTISLIRDRKPWENENEMKQF